MKRNGAGVPLRELRELKTLYHLKPHFRDIVVEGRDDAALVRWFLAEHGARNVKVFAVDDRVYVPSEDVERYHPEVNARGRVIALANLASNWNVGGPSLTCIADSDFDLLDEVDRDVDGLLMTDHAAMDIYSLGSRPLAKFLVACAKADIEVEDLLSLLKPAWAMIYALRYVLHRHTEGAKVVDDFAGSFIKKPGQIALDVKALVRMVKPSQPSERMQELLDLHAAYLARIPETGLAGIRGHDAAPTLIRFLGLKNDLAQPLHVERLLRSSIELRDLDDQPLFSSLLERLSL